MDNTQTILALISTLLGIILVFFRLVEAWPKVSDPIKKIFSNRIVRLAGAALILVGVYFLIEPSLNNYDEKVTVALKTAHNQYVTAMGADREWEIVAETTVVDDYEKFTLLCQKNGKIALQTWHGRYVTAMGADRDWVLLAETTTINDYEIFTILDTETEKQRPCLEVIKSLKKDGQVRIALQTWHKKEGKNRLVTAMDAEWGWKLRAETNGIGASEKFTIILLP